MECSRDGSHKVDDVEVGLGCLYLRMVCFEKCSRKENIGWYLLLGRSSRSGYWSGSEE